jgi:lipopolysaccharide transport system permease protein
MSSELLDDRPAVSSGDSPLNAGDEMAARPPLAETVIEPIGRGVSLNLGEIWRYRDLFALMALRDVSARYRQSVAGFSWALIKPLTSMLIFTFIFGRVAKIPSDGSPYPLFVLAGIIPWFYFSTTLSSVTASISGSGNLLTKVYFPRLILPLVPVTTGLVEVAVQMLVVFGMLVWYGINPGLRLLALPLLIFYASATVLSVGLWLTALNVKYRDVGLATPFLIQSWMWLSPVVYSSDMVNERIRPYFGLNPMVGVIEGFRWMLTGRTQPDWLMMTISGAVVAILLVAGAAFFRKTELTFADVI